ncbi:hypothetical protein HMPREF1981_02632 [Bacteroides pyogenes F0041]|uniref:NigD-like protein n=1 Tax=Bacteroides pyogenes F0041 TaxID=1321819 RepID=U2BVA1_9BACE|nr:NigD-like protein [Bacteroides pyogenes]ERI82124.1 hypothetical protein HMPREF1981_02632 [Bacteroides pyogenes F0041]MBB3895925.1 hypothetical protein [Bacteroides pyogenes]GAE23212.1 hypothetical protein JCM10003_2935 [Bacteroides pyogenes JCM 10003]SUV35338.1 NigD-like protein [Bacteroides pyogenes]
MKKLKIITFILALSGLAPFLQSCLGDDDNRREKLLICTINVSDAEKNRFYLTQDNGQTLFPSDIRYLGNYKPVDGQRAFVTCNFLDEKAAGYDYNIRILKIVNILTKDIKKLNKENEAEIGDDKINQTYMWISKDRKYLTIEYQFYGTYRKDKKHLLNLVINEKKKDITSSAIKDYIELEFRHNAHGDTSGEAINGYVSFKLNEIKDQMKGKKGLKIRVNTIYNGEKTYEVNFPPS